MRFSRIVFTIAGVWGVLVMTPLLFLFDTIGRQDPPPITHPGFYYGFVLVTLAWQIAFFIIARDPVRFRPMMVAAILEKFPYAATATVLFAQHRMRASDMVFVVADTILGILFVIAFVKTGSVPGEPVRRPGL